MAIHYPFVEYTDRVYRLNDCVIFSDGAEHVPGRVPRVRRVHILRITGLYYTK